MKEHILLDAISFLDKSIIEKYIILRMKADKKANSRKSVLTKWAALAAATAFIVPVIFIIVSHLLPLSTDFELPVSADEILWASSNGSNSDNEQINKVWKGLTVTEELYDTLQDADDEEYVAIVFYDFDDSLYSLLNELDYSVTIKSDNLYLFATKAQLGILNGEDLSNYTMHLALRRMFEEIDVPNVKKVNGFVVSKFRFYDSENKYPEVRSDKELCEALNYIMDSCKYNYDYLEFTFYCDEKIDENFFSKLENVNMKRDSYPNRIVVHIKFDDINKNMRELRDLSKKAEIKKIEVSAPKNAITE